MGGERQRVAEGINGLSPCTSRESHRAQACHLAAAGAGFQSRVECRGAAEPEVWARASS